MDRKLFTEVRPLYVTSKESPHEIRVRVRMRDLIDPEALRLAVDTTMQRYPYFCVELQRRDGDFYFENGESPSLVFTLCPVLYDGRFDMSELSFEFATPRIEPSYPTASMFISLVHSTIHKTKEWSNQNEWRLFTWLAPNACPNHCYAQLAAREIIIGPRTDASVAKRLTDIGEKRSIPVRKAIIDVHSRSEELQIA